MLTFTLFAIGSYLCGSLSSAIIVCKAMGLPDPRTQGSNNPGATNVMRIGGKKAAYLTFAGDFLKGLLPVLVAQFFDNPNAIAGAGIGAFVGHLYPLYFGFKGGKGVATLAGVILGVNPLVFLAFGICWLVILFATGYVSLGSMVASVVAVVIALVLGSSSAIVLLLFILSALVIYKHRENIVKLLNGTESHFRKSKNKED